MSIECRKCKYSDSVPGDTHICCRHPALDKLWESPLSELLSIMGKRGGYGEVIFEAIMDIREINKRFAIEGNDHGIKNGWFIWPLNFDPVWLENCNAFEVKK